MLSHVVSLLKFLYSLEDNNEGSRSYFASTWGEPMFLRYVSYPSCMCCNENTRQRPKGLSESAFDWSRGHSTSTDNASSSKGENNVLDLSKNVLCSS